VGKSSTSFKPGTSGNPGGRPVAPEIPDHLREEIRADKIAVKNCIRAYLKLTAPQIQMRIGSQEATAVERMVAQLIQNGMDNHNTARMLFEMAFGDMMQGPTLQDLTLDEQSLVDEYRRRKAQRELEATDAGRDSSEASE